MRARNLRRHADGTGGSHTRSRGGRRAVAVSAVITTFGNGAQCERLVTSLRRGTVVPDEIVIVNNDPYHDLGQCEAFDGSSLQVVEAGRGANLSAARNLGWSCTSGDLCLFVDDDNVVGPTMVEELVRAASERPAAAFAPLVVSYPTDTIWCAGVTRSKWLGRTRFIGSGSRLSSTRAVSDSPDFPNSFMIRANALAAVGGFDETAFPIHFCEADLFARMREAGGGRLEVVPTAVVSHDSVASASVSDELVRYATHGGAARIRATARSRVLFFARHYTGLPRITCVVVGIPVWVIIAVASVLRASHPVRTRCWIVVNLLRGAGQGYRDMWGVVRRSPRWGRVQPKQALSGGRSEPEEESMR